MSNRSRHHRSPIPIERRALTGTQIAPHGAGQTGRYAARPVMAVISFYESNAVVLNVGFNL